MIVNKYDVPLSVQRLHVFTAYSAFKRVVQIHPKRGRMKRKEKEGERKEKGGKRGLRERERERERGTEEKS